MNSVAGIETMRLLIMSELSVVSHLARRGQWLASRGGEGTVSTRTFEKVTSTSRAEGLSNDE